MTEGVTAFPVPGHTAGSVLYHIRAGPPAGGIRAGPPAGGIRAGPPAGGIRAGPPAGGGLLFSGDSLAWDPRRRRLTAFRDACWYSWSEQVASLGRFAHSGLAFHRLFCGHGWSHDAPAEVLAASLADLLTRESAPARR